MKTEAQFQSQLIKELKVLFPDAVVLLTDPSRIQGIPDILILRNNRWAALEVKKTSTASRRPNQEYYVEKLGKMSYAAFIFPDNKEEILDEVQQALGA